MPDRRSAWRRQNPSPPSSPSSHCWRCSCGRIHYLSYAEGLDIISQIEKLPDKVAKALELDSQVAAIARKYSSAKNFLFMGRQANYPIALEGALKLKEISYIAASGYPSAELKHGVIALINEETPSVFIAPRDAVFEKNLSNIEEVKARKGPVIAIGTEGDQSLAKIADDVILHSRKLPITSPRFSQSFPSSSWPTTLPSSSAATWTSLETLPRV